jgi:hypothetical protein
MKRMSLGFGGRFIATVIYHEEDLFSGVTASSFRFGKALHAFPS